MSEFRAHLVSFCANNPSDEGAQNSKLVAQKSESVAPKSKLVVRNSAK